VSRASDLLPASFGLAQGAPGMLRPDSGQAHA